MSASARALVLDTAVVVCLAVPASAGVSEDLIFADGFESGNLLGWEAVDIVVAIDNTSSMTAEIQAFEQQINSFAAHLEQSGLDFRIIMVTNHGSASEHVCVPPPLSQTMNCDAAPVFQEGRFYHYDTDVGSHDAMCRLLAGALPNALDEHARGPWLDWSRPHAFKHLLWISDDGTTCTFDVQSLDDDDLSAAGQTTADDFEDSLLALSPQHFGTASNRRFRSHAIIGLPEKTPSSAVYSFSEPVETGTCLSGAGPGTAYQWLAVKTGGLRAPSCSTIDYGAYFDALASAIVAAAE